MDSTLAVGLISGTSLDGIDGALVAIAGSAQQPAATTLATLALPYPEGLRRRLLHLAEGKPAPVAEVSALHRDVALAFADCALQLIDQAGFRCEQIACIGSHGQTVHHQPPAENTAGHTLQLGDGAWIAERTGVTTVANFRTRDMAAGGQGAPLVPILDYLLLRDARRDRCIQNLGGIANVTYLRAGGGPEEVIAFDTGPANLLIDGTVQIALGEPFDRGGSLALQGTVDRDCLERWLADPYFRRPPPKSTGREYFGYARARRLAEESAHLPVADRVATVSELTVRSIERAYRDFLPRLPEEVFLCGGGARNGYIRARLGRLLAPARVAVSDEAGIDPDFKEAIAFALLAWLRCTGAPGNLPAVTGAGRAVPLGDVHPAG
ncbi:anhydro-N-acetylmuramic acid kinase [Gloeobacter morelensis]|uniref:anhydro-N-acetylmuramic acid kinase n=1 Tax=Gloeobacter morelensis TaxID=2907343 RepID=UPI001E5C7DE0|nr:anhydro-N-acetylmuramic acid kinase [Gloeobacter morelensis]